MLFRSQKLFSQRLIVGKAVHQDYARRFHALMDRFADDQPLRKELLELADLHGLINCRHKHFFFRAGVQLGLALGSIAVLQDR